MSLPRLLLLLSAPGLILAVDATALAQQLSQGTVDERIAAARALTKLGSGAGPAIPELVQAIKDPYWDVRQASTRALAQQGPTVLPQLRAALDHDHYYPPLYAAMALGQMGEAGAGAAERLLQQLYAEDGEHRRWAAWALTRMGSLPEIPARQLANIMAGHEDGHVVTALATVLAHKGGDAREALPVLMEQALAGVATAQQALGAIGAPAVEAVLAHVEAGEKDRKRIWVCISICQQAGPAATAAVPWLIEEADPGRDQWFVAKVMQALAAIGPGASQAVPVIEKTLNHGYANAAANAKQALAAVTGEEAE